MNKEELNLELAKEIFRQAELRVKGIIEFSVELDNKIFKLIGFVLTGVIALLIYLFKNHNTLSYNFFWFGITLEIFLMATVFMLLKAGSPMPYKGAGLSLKSLGRESDFIKVLMTSTEKYKIRFERNVELNEKKAFWLKYSVGALYLTPILASIVFYCL